MLTGSNINGQYLTKQEANKWLPTPNVKEQYLPLPLTK